MEEKDLLELRGYRSFHDLNEFYNESKRIIPTSSKIPVIFPYRVRYLDPSTNSDRLTVENYFEGMEEIKKEFDRDPFTFNSFKGGINLDKEKTLIYLSGKDFGTVLNISWAEERFYTARSHIHKSIFLKIVRNHIGPNRVD